MSSANLSIILIFLSLVETTNVETGSWCLAVQEKLNIAVLRLLSLERPVCSFVLSWHMGTWILEGVPLFPN